MKVQPLGWPPVQFTTKGEPAVLRITLVDEQASATRRKRPLQLAYGGERPTDCGSSRASTMVRRCVSRWAGAQASTLGAAGRSAHTVIHL